MKNCSKCKILKSLCDFFKDSHSLTGYRSACKKCITFQNVQYYQKNSRRLLEAKRLYNEKNKLHFKAKKRIWHQKNLFRVRALSAKRKNAKLNRTPKWLTKLHWNEINLIYQTAHERSKVTGLAWEVDHIIPLRGKNVSGLHVPWNLQIISRQDNIKKGNKF